MFPDYNDLLEVLAILLLVQRRISYEDITRG
ncbi:hypothetical protein SRRS_01380 [Sporomusa rhizae]